MDPIQIMQRQTQEMVKSLFLHHKLTRSLFLMYLLLEVVTLSLLSAAYLMIGITPLQTLLAFVGISAAYTFFFFMSFSYLLYNLVKINQIRKSKKQIPRVFYR